jgi:hypothetical protein
MRIGNALLDGITTVTPNIRYLGVLCWITKVYWEQRGSDDYQDYLQFSRSVESAIVFGNLLVDPKATGLVGSDDASETLLGEGPVSLASQVKAIATTIYAGPAEQLGLISYSPTTDVPRLTSSRGMKLANAMHQAARKTALGRKFSEGDIPSSASREELRELGAALELQELPDSERAVLIDVLMPEEPIDQTERSRTGTYATLMALAPPLIELAPDNPRTLLDTASSRSRKVPKELYSVLDDWALYHVRDLLAVIHERALSCFLESLRGANQTTGGPVDYDQVIQSALALNTSQDTGLKDLGLLEDGETWSSLRFRDLTCRIDAATNTDLKLDNGLRRWNQGIQECDVIRSANSAKDGVFALLPVAWLHVIRRTEEGIISGSEGFEALSRQPFARLGVREVLIPWKERCLAENPLLPEIVGGLIETTVTQHLRTAWSRMALDPRKDVALLVTDGLLWQARGQFSGGRTNSRLGQAAGWLTQLQLLESGSVTERGTNALNRAVNILGAHD